MRYKQALIASFVLIATSLAFACSGSDGGDPNPTEGASIEGDTITAIRTGNGVSGSFRADGPFDVRVVGNDVTVDNSQLIVFEVQRGGEGSRTAIVAGSGPKAAREGVTQRPGEILDLTFDIGPGEYYVLLKTESASLWTMTVEGVALP